MSLYKHFLINCNLIESRTTAEIGAFGKTGEPLAKCSPGQRARNTSLPSRDLVTGKRCISANGKGPKSIANSIAQCASPTFHASQCNQVCMHGIPEKGNTTFEGSNAMRQAAFGGMYNCRERSHSLEKAQLCLGVLILEPAVSRVGYNQKQEKTACLPSLDRTRHSKEWRASYRPKGRDTQCLLLTSFGPLARSTEQSEVLSHTVQRDRIPSILFFKRSVAKPWTIGASAIPIGDLSARNHRSMRLAVPKVSLLRAIAHSNYEHNTSPLLRKTSMSSLSSMPYSRLYNRGSLYDNRVLPGGRWSPNTRCIASATPNSQKDRSVQERIKCHEILKVVPHRGIQDPLGLLKVAWVRIKINAGSARTYCEAIHSTLGVKGRTIPLLLSINSQRESVGRGSRQGLSRKPSVEGRRRRSQYHCVIPASRTKVRDLRPQGDTACSQGTLLGTLCIKKPAHLKVLGSLHSPLFWLRNTSVSLRSTIEQAQARSFASVASNQSTFRKDDHAKKRKLARATLSQGTQLAKGAPFGSGQALRTKDIMNAVSIALKRLEPLHADCSHAFRADRSQHTCLRQIQTEFVKVQEHRNSWLIIGDTTSAFAEMNHTKCDHLFSKTINDSALCNLVHNCLVNTAVCRRTAIPEQSSSSSLSACSLPGNEPGYAQSKPSRMRVKSQRRRSPMVEQTSSRCVSRRYLTTLERRWLRPLGQSGLPRINGDHAKKRWSLGTRDTFSTAKYCEESPKGAILASRICRTRLPRLAQHSWLKSKMKLRAVMDNTVLHNLDMFIMRLKPQIARVSRSDTLERSEMNIAGRYQTIFNWGGKHDTLGGERSEPIDTKAKSSRETDTDLRAPKVNRRAFLDPKGVEPHSKAMHTLRRRCYRPLVDYRLGQEGQPFQGRTKRDTLLSKQAKSRPQGDRSLPRAVGQNSPNVHLAAHQEGLVKHTKRPPGAYGRHLSSCGRSRSSPSANRYRPKGPMVRAKRGGTTSQEYRSPFVGYRSFHSRYLGPQDNYNTVLPQLHYTRYSHHFMIGVCGSKELAMKIVHIIGRFLEQRLELRLQANTLKIHNLCTEQIPFLGYLIHRNGCANKVVPISYGGQHANESSIRMLVNIAQVIHSLSEKGFCDRSGKPKPNFHYFQDTQHNTIARVASVLRGLANYYDLADNKRRCVARWSYILTHSIAMMFAAKFKLGTRAKVFSLAGRNLSKPL